MYVVELPASDWTSQVDCKRIEQEESKIVEVDDTWIVEVADTWIVEVEYYTFEVELVVDNTVEADDMLLAAGYYIVGVVKHLHK
jgi:hypothetical protein